MRDFNICGMEKGLLGLVSVDESGYPQSLIEGARREISIEKPKVWEFFPSLSDEIAQLAMYARQKGLKLKETIYMGFPGTFYSGDKEDFARGVKSDVGLGKMFKDTGSFLDWQIKPSRIIETLLAMKLKRPRFNVVARNDSLAWALFMGHTLLRKTRKK